MPSLDRDDAVYVLDLGGDENRFAPAWIKEVNGLLDTVVQGSEAAALVTAGHGRFPAVDINIGFSPGMAALVQSKLTSAAAITAMTTGRRFDGPTAQEYALVDRTADDGLRPAWSARASIYKLNGLP